METNDYWDIIKELETAPTFPTESGIMREIQNVHFSVAAGTIIGRPGFTMPIPGSSFGSMLGVEMAFVAMCQVFFGTTHVIGIRAKAQMKYIEQAFFKNLYTKSAALQISTLYDLASLRKRDQFFIPNVQIIHFMVRDEALDAIIMERDANAVFGIPKNVVVIGGMVKALAKIIKVAAGTLYFNYSTVHIEENTNVRFYSGKEENEYFNITFEPQHWSEVQRAGMLCLDSRESWSPYPPIVEIEE